MTIIQLTRVRAHVYLERTVTPQHLVAETAAVLEGSRVASTSGGAGLGHARPRAATSPVRAAQLPSSTHRHVGGFTCAGRKRHLNMV